MTWRTLLIVVVVANLFSCALNLRNAMAWRRRLTALQRLERLRARAFKTKAELRGAAVEAMRFGEGGGQ
jgi:hypothetical protein